MTTIAFDTDLRLPDGTGVAALFTGYFEINRHGEIDEIALEVLGNHRPTRHRYIDGPLFDLLKPHLERAYEGDIIDALIDMRESAAADKADRDNDARWADA